MARPRTCRTIGVVGGVGPYAGLDLVRKVLDQTRAGTDQEHLPIALLSLPARIADRTEYLLGRTRRNPADAIFRVVRQLERVGARVVGIPCNTSHARPIFGRLRERLAAAGSKATLVHMIEEVGRFLVEHHPGVRRVGLLSTTGTYRSRVYPDVLEPLGREVLLPEEPVQEAAVHRAIYDGDFGLKARAHPPTAAARRLLDEAVGHLRAKGAEAVILGCTELPLAVTGKRIGGTLIIDPTLILARALIREAAPEKLKDLEP